MTIPVTSAVGTTATTSLHTTASTATPKQEMDKEVFLALLVAQLRNQDPTAPMDTTEMMAQSTQMASMEQLTSLTDTSRESFALQMRIAASGMVGQQVSWVDEDGATQSGLATGVTFENAVPMVTVGDVKVPLDAVSAIRSHTPTPPATTAPAAGAPTTDSATQPA